jgi:hypothetical protein
LSQPQLHLLQSPSAAALEACPDQQHLLPAPAQMVAEAMMALLPGIDANDEDKTSAVFKFYTSVLSSLPYMGEQHGEQPAFEVPLYLEDWVDEVRPAAAGSGGGCDRA